MIPDYKKDVNSAAERLDEVSPYEGSEVGEYWRCLCDLWDRNDICSDEFKTALEKEIVSEATRTHTEFELVEDTVTFTKPVKNLEWIGSVK